MTAGPAFARFDDLLADAFDRHWTGRERLTVSQWAERYRVIATGGTHPGPWRNDRVPFLVPVMDSVCDPGVSDVTLRCGSQVGKTEVLINVVLWHLDTHAANVMFVSGNIDLARDMNTERVLPALRESLAADRVLTGRPHDEKTESVTTRNGRLYFQGANSPTGLASKAVRLMAGDEVGKWPEQVNAKGQREGSAYKLARARITAFGDEGVMICASTPNTAGSNIDALYDASDRGHLRCPCPHCGWWQRVVFANVRWPDYTDQGEKIPLRYLSEEQLAAHAERVKHESVYACARCGAAITDADRPGMMRAAVWVRAGEEQDPETGAITGEPVVRGHRGFAFNRLHMPGKSWGEVSEEFVRLRGRPTQDWVNNALGEAWEPAGTQAKDELQRAYAADRERAARPAGSSVVVPAEAPRPGDPHYVPVYQRGVVPPGVLMLVCGADVQHDRVKAAVWGFGEHDRAYLIDLVEVPWPVVPAEDAPAARGAPYPLERAEAVRELLLREWPPSEARARLDPAPVGVKAWGIDAGHRPGEVYSLCRAMPRRVHPLLGRERLDQPEGLRSFDPSKVISDKGARASDAAHILDRRRYEVNTAVHKSLAAARLRTRPPAYGACVMPLGLRPHEIAELEAEHEVSEVTGGRRVFRFKPRKGAPAWDYWDATVYAFAMAEGLLGGGCSAERVERLVGGSRGAGGGDTLRPEPLGL